MRNGPFPGLGRGAGQRPLEPDPLEGMENKIAAQVAEIERLTRENHRLAGTHVSLFQALLANQEELRKLKAHMRSLRTESDIQIRLLLEKIKKMEVDIRAGEKLKIDVQQAHKESHRLITTGPELELDIQLSTRVLQRAHAEFDQLPELHEELNKLREELHGLRAAFEYEKGLNMEQVEKLYAREKNLISVAKEVEKLRNEASNAEGRGRAAQPNRTTYRDSDS